MENNKIIKLFKEYTHKESQNGRKTMEDYIKIIPKYSNQDSKAYFAIFDGHSGKDAAKYCKDHLDRILSTFLYKTNFNLNKSIYLTFQKINHDFLSNFPNTETGSTATVIFIFKQYNCLSRKSDRIISCSNVGDSKAYLVLKNKTKIQLTTDHKCSDAKEVERVKSAGGLVFSGRVYGKLMLTRTIGDSEMKRYGVIFNPSHIQRTIDDNNDWFIILASDGLWDCIDDASFDNILNSLNTNDDANTIINKFNDVSLKGGMGDNVSIIVIIL